MAGPVSRAKSHPSWLMVVIHAIVERVHAISGYPPCGNNIILLVVSKYDMMKMKMVRVLACFVKEEFNLLDDSRMLLLFCQDGVLANTND